MRKLTFKFIVILLLTLSVVLPKSYAQDDKVYITESGKKYHKRTCSNTKGKTGMSLSSAKAKGYDACEKCFSMVKSKLKTKKKITRKA